MEETQVGNESKPVDPSDDQASREMRDLQARIAQLEVWVSELRHKAGITEVDELYEQAQADR